MGSDLYRVKVGEPEAVDWPSEELLNTKFAADMPEFVPPLGLEVDETPLRFGELRDLIIEQFSELAEDEVLRRLERGFFYEPEIGTLLAMEPASLSMQDMSMADFQLLGHQLAAHLMPERFKPVPLVRVELDVAQIHPDAYLPDSFQVSHFCLRVLTEATAEAMAGAMGGIEEAPLFRYFHDQGSDWYADGFGNATADDAAFAIIASARMLDASENESQKGFWIATFEVILHQDWLPMLPKHSFFSRAY